MGLSARTKQFLISISLILLNGHFQMLTTLGSEFPERECCDPVYPIPVPGSGNTLSAGHGAIAPAPAAFPEYAPPTPSSSVTTEIPGVQTKTATAIMNCIQARDFCMDNPACSPILEIVPRVCGPEKVACTTLTVNKCQAALRTLQAFPYFYPTCLCREPSSDPACNAFREYLFDHPCSFVKEKEKDPYSVDALPTCDYAMDVCKQQPKCHQLYRDFKTHCPASGGTCKMDDGEICHGAWTKLRLSPMFGCICPNGGPRCDRIFSEVNYNPCVATEATSVNFTGTSSALSLDVPRRRSFLQFSFTPSTLFPKPGTHLHRHRHQHEPLPPAARTDSHLFVDESLSTPVSYHAIPSPGSFSTSHSGSLTVQVIASSHSPDHETDTQLETPLLGSASNVAEQQNKPPPFMPPIHSPPPPPKSTMSRQEGAEQGSRPHPRHSGGIATISSIRTHGGGERSGRVALHTTCSTALLNCQQSPACAKPLRNVLYWCEPSRCRQETCMQALQNFYRGVQERYAIEVAFCLCRKSDNRLDQECLRAQGQLHPVCAQRGDLGISPPSCHSLAENCREQPDCKSRLETYEKACSVDSVTRKCAGPTTQCRNATVGILGTVLKKSCACNGTDYNQLYDCLGWQRILWVNPCVVESQRDYHRVRSTTSTSSAPQRSTTMSNLGLVSTEDTLMGTDLVTTTLGNPVLAYVDTRAEVTTEKVTTPVTRARTPTTRHHHRHEHSTHEVVFVTSRTSGAQTQGSTAEEFTTLITTTTRTPTSTAPPHKYCIVQRNNLPPQQILEGMARRFYREDRRSCSELCICSGIRLTASCNVLTCLDSTRSLSCSQKQRDNKTLMYSHEDPSYQANRGRCMCYAGSFVCVKPSQEKYNLNRGVFLFIGYSKVDQDVMRPYTNVESTKVIETLRNLINPALHHQFANPGEEGTGLEAFKELNTTECHLGLFKDEEENIIINATIADQEFGNFTLRQPNDELLIEEKTKCGPILQVLSNLINDKKPVIQSHPLLSILKLAEVVENKIPNMRSSVGRPGLTPPLLVTLLLVLLTGSSLTSSL